MSEKLGSVLRSWRKRKGLFKDLDPPQNSDSCIKGSVGPGPECTCHPRSRAGFPNGLLLTAVELGARKHSNRQEKLKETKKGDLRAELKVFLCFSTLISRERRKWVDGTRTSRSGPCPPEDKMSSAMDLKNDKLHS